MDLRRFSFELIKVEDKPGLSLYPFRGEHGCNATKDFLMELKNMLVPIVKDYEGEERTRLERTIDLIIEEIVNNRD